MYHNDKPSPGFKYRPRLKLYTDGTNNTFNPESFNAVSYNWWTYCCKVRGKVVFNNYPYSNTTQKHQDSMRDLLKKLRIKIDVFVSTRTSLDMVNGNIVHDMIATLEQYKIKISRMRKQGLYVEELKQYFKTNKAAISALEKNIETVCQVYKLKVSTKERKAIQKRVADADFVEREKTRLIEREKRAKRKAIERALAPELNDLGSIDLVTPFEKLNDLQAI